MFESMFKRQSIRSYKMEKSDQMRQEIQNVIDDLLPLGKRPVYMDLIETEAGDKKAWAPYYVFIRTNQNDVDGDAVGFKGEQMVLKLASMG